MKYKCYHSCVKICHALGIEKQLISKEFLRSIAPSTAHYWKDIPTEKYLGFELSKSVDENLGDVQMILDERLRGTKEYLLLFVNYKLH